MAAAISAADRLEHLNLCNLKEVSVRGAEVLFQLKNTRCAKENTLEKELGSGQ